LIRLEASLFSLLQTPDRSSYTDDMSDENTLLIRSPLPSEGDSELGKNDANRKLPGVGRGFFLVAMLGAWI
jgi:hypothetical protein